MALGTLACLGGVGRTAFFTRMGSEGADLSPSFPRSLRTCSRRLGWACPAVPSRGLRAEAGVTVLIACQDCRRPPHSLES